MKYGINTFLWSAGFNESHLPLLPKIKEMGFDGAELARFSFHDCPAAPIRRALEANQLEATFCTALTGQLSLANEHAPQALTFLKDAIHWASEVGAKVMAGPFCSAVGYLPGRRRTPDEWQRAIDGLQSLTPTLEETAMTLAVEPLNRFETFFLNTAEDARALCSAVNHPQVGILFDTFHANIEEKNLAPALETVGPYLKHIHSCENDRGAPGSGHVQWTDLFPTLAKLGYNEWLVIESFGSTISEIAAAACIWRDLAPSSEALASQGVQFLKRLAQSSGSKLR